MEKQIIDTTLSSLYAKGYTRFLCGITEEKGLKPLKAILLLREICPDIEILGMISPSNRKDETCKDLFETADSFCITSDAYFEAAFCRPNEFLVNSGGVIISHIDQQDGSTIYAFTEKDFGKMALLVQFDELNLNSPFR